MTHTVYADILFIVNTYVNYALIRLTGLICHRTVKSVRLLAAAALGGAYSFIILVDNIPVIVTLASRIAFAAVIIMVSFGFENKKAFMRSFAAFFFVSFVFAGIMFFLWNFLSPSSMVYNNTIVYFDIDTLSLCIMTIICYVLVRAINKILRFRTPENTIYDLSFTAFEKDFSCSAFLDTGNCLREPFSSLPVIIVNQDVRCKDTGITLKNVLSAKESQLRYIPCTSVGGDTALMAFRPDKIGVRGISIAFETNDAYIAITDKKIKGGDFDALLGGTLFENRTRENEKDYIR